MISSCSQHQSLKRAFLFAPYGDYDTKFVSDLQNENGLSSVQVKHWFMVMRQRMNVKEFVFGDIEYNDINDENVTDNIKQSGRSPLDVLVDFPGLKLQPTASVGDKGDDTRSENDSGNFEGDVSSEEEDSVFNKEKDTTITKRAPGMMWTYGAPNVPSFLPKVNAPSFDTSPNKSSPRRESFEEVSLIEEDNEENDNSRRTPEMWISGAPDSWDSGSDVSNEAEVLHVNAPSFICSTPNKNGKCQKMPEVRNLKKEKLSVEEKAKRYDLLKLGIEVLVKQMEVMRERLEAQNPPAEVNIKQEPGLQQLSQQPFPFQQTQMVDSWPQQQAQQPLQFVPLHHELPPQLNYQTPPPQWIPRHHQPHSQYYQTPQKLNAQHHPHQGVFRQRY